MWVGDKKLLISYWRMIRNVEDKIGRSLPGVWYSYSRVKLAYLLSKQSSGSEQKYLFIFWFFKLFIQTYTFIFSQERIHTIKNND